MPAWFAALSPQTILVAIAGTGGVIALLLAVAAVRRMRDWEIRRGSVTLLGAALVAALGVGGAMLAASLHTYTRLTHEQEAARAVLRALGPQRYELLLLRAGEPTRSYELRGDEWQIDARVLKWKGWANVLGLDASYRLERVSGRYGDVEQERTAPRSVYALSEEPAIDLWTLVLTGAMVLMIAAGTAWLPARRAAAVDPIEALRTTG